MLFSILVLGEPCSSQSVNTALRFARASLQQGHRICRVFFYHAGVHCGNALITPPQDEVSLPSEWQQLAEHHELELTVCIASALKRGVLNATEAERHEKTASNLAQGFEIAGLGQLIDAIAVSDQLITFGD